MDSDLNNTILQNISATSISPYAGNRSNNTSDASSSNTHLTQMQIALYILIAIVGTIGNTLTITVLLKHDFRKRKSSILLLNLAICDALIAGICIPLDVVYFLKNAWVYGRHLCYIISPFQTSMPIVSSWTFMFMMLERNSLFAKTIHGQMRRRSVRIFAMSTWLVAFVLVVPYGLRLQASEKDGEIKCHEHWENEIGRKSYTVILSVIEFLVPMLIITVFVIRICINLSRQSQQIRMNSLGLNNAKKQLRLRQNRNITMMFIVMIAVYASLKLPNNIFWQWSEFSGETDLKKKNLIWMFVSLAAYSTSMVNPLVLAGMSCEFRGAFKEILKCHMCINASSQCVCSFLRGFQNDFRDSTDVMPSSPESTKQAYSVSHVEMNDVSVHCARKELLMKLEKFETVQEKQQEKQLLNDDTNQADED